MNQANRLIVLPILLLWSALAGAGQGSVAALDTATAQSRVVAREQVLDGVVEAVSQSTVSAQISGRITAVNFDVDDFVPKGAVLVRFRDNELRARLEQAQASLKEAQARFVQARADHQRISDVYRKRLVAKARLDQATAELKAARARLDAAKARVNEAREQLDHTVVKAPYSGIVIKRSVEPGETARVGQPLMTGLSLEHLRVAVPVPQQYIDAVRRIGRARFVAPLPPGSEVTVGKLTVFPYADPATHTFRVRVDLPAAPHGLYPGMLAKVAFTTGERRRLLVPQQAVVHRSEVTAVYVLAADGSLGFRQVRAGRALANGMTEILAGLDAGERVALDPVRAGVLLKQQRAEHAR
ncbi:MAG: efflux RND transporter periplasmic adaptor subunit [Gammaproteobacteria bacterium]